MPHLHLPVDHTDADVVLAANLAEIVGSEDLYVAWSHQSGAGAIPEIQAVLIQPRPLHPFADFGAALAAAFGAMWRALVGRPRSGDVQSAPPADPAKRAAA